METQPPANNTTISGEQFFQLISCSEHTDQADKALLEALLLSKQTPTRHHLHKSILLHGFRWMKDRTFISLSNRYFPFMNHTNMKILVFLSLIGYCYFKMKRLTPRNHHWYRLVDNVSVKISECSCFVIRYCLWSFWWLRISITMSLRRDSEVIGPMWSSKYFTPFTFFTPHLSSQIAPRHSLQLHMWWIDTENTGKRLFLFIIWQFITLLLFHLNSLVRCWRCSFTRFGSVLSLN